MSWLAVVLVVVPVGLLLYWLLVTTEGTYLGAKVVAMLYNGCAWRYDAMKKFDPQFEELFLTSPILSALKGQRAPLVLDVATGTGRVPALLLSAPAFDGHVFGLDYAREMLAVAAGKTANYRDRVTFIWQNAMQLPFPDASFDLVTCLEALEFMPRPKKALAEIVRVLRPGGMVLTTHRRGWERKVMPGRGWSEDDFRTLLSTYGLQNVKLLPWQLDYSLAWGRVSGNSAESIGLAGRRDDLLRCPGCQGRPLVRENSTLCCPICDKLYIIAADGIIEMADSHLARRRE